MRLMEFMTAVLRMDVRPELVRFPISVDIIFRSESLAAAGCSARIDCQGRLAWEGGGRRDGLRQATGQAQSRKTVPKDFTRSVSRGFGCDIRGRITVASTVSFNSA